MKPRLLTLYLAVTLAVTLDALALTGQGWAASKSAAISSPQPEAAKEPPRFQGMVEAHNRARRAVGVPDIAWSDQLAKTAQSWADKLGGEGCEMRHSGVRDLGENLAWAARQHLTPAEVAAMWVIEGAAFDPVTGACAPNAVCGHYTQVVWRDTRFVGCGMASCGSSEIWVCNYSPPGNYIGERPY